MGKCIYSDDEFNKILNYIKSNENFEYFKLINDKETKIFHKEYPILFIGTLLIKYKNRDYPLKLRINFVTEIDIKMYKRRLCLQL